jgi:hypothetical protein
MNDASARYGAMTGIVFVLVVIVGFAVTPQPPDANAAPAEILNYVVDHHSAMHAVQLILAAAGFLFIWFIGTLPDYLSRIEVAAGRHALANLAWGGGLIAIATLMIGGAFAATATLLIPAIGAPAAAVFFVGNGLSILRSGALPAWLGLVTALFNALGISAVFTDHGAFAADGVLGFLLFILWTLLASITLVRSLGNSGSEVSA